MLACHSKKISGVKNGLKVFDGDGENGSANEKKYCCVYCGAEYGCQSSLKRHYLEKHPNENFPIPIVNDNKNASGKKRWTCMDCSTTFSCQSALDSHKVANNCHVSTADNSGVGKQWPPLRCGDCGAGYAKQHALDLHILNKHSNEQKATEQTSFLCVECGITYKRDEALQKHILADHSKKFKCEKCNFTTGSKEKLSKYEK